MWVTFNPKEIQRLGLYVASPNSLLTVSLVRSKPINPTASGKFLCRYEPPALTIRRDVNLQSNSPDSVLSTENVAPKRLEGKVALEKVNLSKSFRSI